MADLWSVVGAMDTMAPGSYLLTVLTGPNAGAQVNLASRKVTVGADDTSDIILDDFVGPDVEFTVAKDKLRVLTSRSDSSVAPHGKLSPGKPFYTELPATIQVDPTVQVNLCRNYAPSRPGPRRLKWLAAALVVLGIGIGGHLVIESGGFGVVQDAMASVGTERQLEIASLEFAEPAIVKAVAPEPAVLPPTPLPVATADDALAFLIEMINIHGLPGLDVSADNGLVRVTGSLVSREASVWQQIRNEYDLQFGQVAPLLVNLSEESDAAPLAVASVWLGETPELTTRAGTVLRIGDATESGWIVKLISTREVQLERGPRRVTIDF